jgi:hypothetical protein
VVHAMCFLEAVGTDGNNSGETPYLPFDTHTDVRALQLLERHLRKIILRHLHSTADGSQQVCVNSARRLRRPWW